MSSKNPLSQRGWCQVQNETHFVQANIVCIQYANKSEIPEVSETKDILIRGSKVIRLIGHSYQFVIRSSGNRSLFRR